MTPAAIAHPTTGVGPRWTVRKEDAAFPERLSADPRPPAQLHGAGDPRLLSADLPRVAIVGARRCTPYGARTAHRFGRQLAEAGVIIVSGLAAGIDGAGHEGALAVGDGAPPIGVVGTGLDVVYPRRHRELWRQIAEAGCLVSEFDARTAAESWRFPLRNRIIAALADVVLVVEAHPDSGTRHTVDAAIERNRQVLAVPGPVDSPASAGANQLLREGCSPACEVDDVLMALGLSQTTSGSSTDHRPPPDPRDDRTLAVLDWTPLPLETVMARSGRPLPEIVTSLHRLRDAGWAGSADGCWFRLAPG